jgi:hypothetical protein
MAGEKPRIVFVLGMTNRCGSTYVADLLRLHPLCSGTRPDVEDYFVYHADKLVDFAQQVSSAGWERKSKEPDITGALLQHLGNGVVAFLAMRGRRGSMRIVVKTPNVRNLNHFFAIFPQEYLILVVRDGRSVLESNARSFHRPFEQVARKWADAAAAITRFDEAHRDSGRNYLVIRYEDLVSNTETELRRMIGFIGLDPEAIDYGVAANLPVRGSSDTAGPDGSGLHWAPVEKTPAFRPLDRWRDWDRARHEAFNRIAGDQLGQLGYRAVRFD